MPTIETSLKALAEENEHLRHEVNELRMERDAARRRLDRDTSGLAYDIISRSRPPNGNGTLIEVYFETLYDDVAALIRDRRESDAVVEAARIVAHHTRATVGAEKLQSALDALDALKKA